MNRQREIINQAKILIDLVQTLNTEINRAGGRPFSFDELDKTSALELIALLAPNGITFVCPSTRKEKPAW